MGKPVWIEVMKDCGFWFRVRRGPLVGTEALILRWFGAEKPYSYLSKARFCSQSSSERWSSGILRQGSRMPRSVLGTWHTSKSRVRDFLGR